MKIFGKEYKEENKGYFGVRRCNICNNELRDVDLVEIYAVNYFCCIPVSRTLVKRVLVCQHCKAYMEIDDKLWKYYSSYYGERFSKDTTDDIVEMLTSMSNQMEKNGVKLEINDKFSASSLDLIYKSLTEKYHVWQNVEEIISVFYK